MNFGLPAIFSDTNNRNVEPFPYDSQILLFPNDIPAKLHEYELTTLSITNGRADKYLINYKDKILLKLLTIRYKDKPTSVFVDNYVIQIKYLIVACKFDFINIILKIIFTVGGDPFSFVSSKIKSYYMEQKDPQSSKIEPKVMRLWESNFSKVQSRIKFYTSEYILNDRILLKPNNTAFYNCLEALKNRITHHLKHNKFHFSNYSTIKDSMHLSSNNSTLLDPHSTITSAENKKLVNQCTRAIEVIHNKIVSIDIYKLELFSWTIAISLLNRLNLDKALPEDLLRKIQDFTTEKCRPHPPSSNNTNNSTKRQTINIKNGSCKKVKNVIKDQTSITNYFKVLN